VGVRAGRLRRGRPKLKSQIFVLTKMQKTGLLGVGGEGRHSNTLPIGGPIC
jgi:hypothetical protein